MDDQSKLIKAALVAAVGLASMAAAMGIGRFAFTPLFPLMQESQGLTLADGASLAEANYLGYLIGAIVGFAWPMRPGTAARTGLALVALSTLAMGSSDSMLVWLALRMLSGVASAWVLVGTSSWALGHLAATGREDLGGWVFAGVGFGIAFAGVVGLVTGVLAGDPAHAWLLLGAISTCVAAATWRAFGRAAPSAAPAPSTIQARGAPATEIDRSSWILVVCYGAFGFGYIVPATFLPAVARAFVADPAVFGWTWPVFGVAAAASTIAVAALTTRAAPRTVATISLLVMAAGVAAPVVRMSIASLLFSAICVGGTFMVMTMAGMQEARRIAAGSGSGSDSGSRLIAGMTAAFALGQLAGPLLARSGPSAVAAMRVPSIVAATVLLVAALVLALDRPRTPASSVEGSH